MRRFTHEEDGFSDMIEEVDGDWVGWAEAQAELAQRDARIAELEAALHSTEIKLVAKVDYAASLAGRIAELEGRSKEALRGEGK